MKKVTVTYGLLLTFLLCISSCVSKKKYNELGQYYENIENDLAKARKQIDTLKQELVAQKALNPSQEKLPLTTYKFDKLSHDFGDIILGKRYLYTFRYTNTGPEKLVFTSVRGSCTCTVPKYTKETIKPGETGEITVVFTPGMPLAKQTKYVTITANTLRKIAVISVSGDVKKGK